MPPATLHRKKYSSSSGRKWVLARKIVQYLFLVLFLLLFVMSRRDHGWAGSWVNIPIRLDLLAALSYLLASRTLLEGFALSLILLLLTLLFGRAWCGWVCPLGTCLDLIPLKSPRGKRKPPAESWRKVKYLLLAAILTSALLGNLALLSLDPLTLLLRALTTAVWPGLDRILQLLEGVLYRLPFLSGEVAAFDALIRPGLFPESASFFQDSILFGALLGGVFALNLWAERFWCRYLCPLGGLLGLISKISLFRRVVRESCPGCLLCSADCPTGAIDPAGDYRSDPAECTLCLDCMESCPRSGVAIRAGKIQPKWNTYDPARREALLTVGLTAGAALLASSGASNRGEPPFLLRPPGVREANRDLHGMTDCIRCSECMRTCPTNAIQPAVFEGGVQGFGSPLIIPRLGYCDYSCNACGQVCPSQAIPPLELAEKQRQVIGRAYIDENRCIAWADHIECLVCEEMCPLPEKAIRLDAQEVSGLDGAGVRIRLPRVLRDSCIGCGICEYKCPVPGEAAIRVHVPEAVMSFE